MDTILAKRLLDSDTDYKFGRLKAAKASVLQKISDAAQSGCSSLPLLDLGIGESDLPADPAIVEVLLKEAGKKENRAYTDNGLCCFQEAACRYLNNVFHVEGLDPARHIIHGIGSKSILSLLPLCLIDQGDILLMPVPGYPVLATHVQYLGGTVYPLPLIKENDYLPDFDQIPLAVCKKAKILYLNYPSNPTGASATPVFFKKAIEFAKRHHIVIVHDAAYAAITYQQEALLSFLSVPGAMEVGVEIHSLSKAFSMTGWRLAFLAGNESIIKAFGLVKGNSDSGQFAAIQKAGSYALLHPDITIRIRQRFEQRMLLLVTALKTAGFPAAMPKAGYYCYVPAPTGACNTGCSDTSCHAVPAGCCTFSSAKSVAACLLETLHISVIPWDDAGAYLRFSVTWENDSRTDVEIMEDFTVRLLSLHLTFS